MGKEDKKEPFLTNLGRATMRGLRRCQKCGTFNGTRGYSCKNKNCDVVFKESGGRKKSSTEPCKINTGNSAQIYSVRVRDKGPDYRGFVQLGTVHGNGNDLLLNSGFSDAHLLVEEAKCFVESCQKINKYSLSSHSNSNACNCYHIRAAAHCYKDAQPLALKNSVLNSLPIPPEFKDEIYQLATDTAGPLVQRVSKNLVVVKCKPDNIHPLGFLHFNFIQTKNKKFEEHKFYCSCRTFKYQSTSKESYRKCVHLYACIVAFASDDCLASEFSYFIDLVNKESVENISLDLIVEKEEIKDPLCISEGEEHGDRLEDDSGTGEEVMEEVSEQSFFILNGSAEGTPCQVEVEVVGSDSGLMDLPISTAETVCTEVEDGLHLHTSDGGTISVHQIPENISIPGLKRKQDESIVQASSALLTLQKSATKRVEGKALISNLASKKLKDVVDESKVSYVFTSWLASVTERINQSMHYGFSGKPEPLVFHLPKVFFDCLLERINKSIGSKKRKMIQETQTFVRKDAVPLGKFTKYTWKLTTLAHVQEVFYNSEIPLDSVRYFSMQKDGSFKSCSTPQVPPPNNNLGHQSGSQPIRPREYKTVLRVGAPCPILVRDITPFIIEWIPGILPRTQIGELRLKYEFDHYCNGQIVLKNQPVIVPKPHFKSSKSLGPPLAPRPPQTKALTALSNTDSLISIPITSDSLSSGDSITVLTF